MSERYMVATAFDGKIVDCTGCKNWSSKSLILLSMWLAAKADGVQSVEELYRRYGVNEPYSENQKIAEEVATWSDELIVVDLDERNIYFDTASRSPYSAALHRDREVVNMSSVRMLAEVDNAYGWDDYYGYGSACCSGKRMPFDCFNHELLVKYCEEYYGWTMPAHEPIARSESDDATIEVDDADEEDYSGISKEVLERYGNLGIRKDVLKEYGEKWLEADAWALLIPNKKSLSTENELLENGEGELLEDDEELLTDEEEQEPDCFSWPFEDKPSWLICWEDIRTKMTKTAEEDK